MSDNNEIIDGVGGTCGTAPWAYTDVVKDHFFHPRNVLFDNEPFPANGTGTTGSPACGDVMMVAIEVDDSTKRIRQCKWRTFGCASAIASTSMMSLMVTEGEGMTLAKAKRLKPEEIIERLGGLPDRKFHCSVLGHLALREAVLDYEQNHD